MPGLHNYPDHYAALIGTAYQARAVPLDCVLANTHHCAMPTLFVCCRTPQTKKGIAMITIVVANKDGTKSPPVVIPMELKTFSFVDPEGLLGYWDFEGANCQNAKFGGWTGQRSGFVA